jgi:hypothetical protein
MDGIVWLQLCLVCGIVEQNGIVWMISPAKCRILPYSLQILNSFEVRVVLLIRQSKLITGPHCSQSVSILAEEGNHARYIVGGGRRPHHDIKVGKDLSKKHMQTRPRGELLGGFAEEHAIQIKDQQLLVGERIVCRVEECKILLDDTKPLEI